MEKQIIEVPVSQMPWAIKSTQEWFAGVITQPLGDHGGILSHAPGGHLIAEEAACYIVPSPTLRPHQRMQIYNQQYWWRLLNALHVNFPLTVRLFGIQGFNEKIAIPYLLKHPPRHWSLARLGEDLPEWIEAYYREPDQSLIHHAAVLDGACIKSFTAPERAPLDLSSFMQGDSESLLARTFHVQPHLRLFTWDYDLFAFRSAFLKENIEYWMDHRFPELPKGRTYYFVLYRNHDQRLAWREISEGEHLVLERFERGTSIGEACEYIAGQSPELSQLLADHLEEWLQQWARAGWLTLSLGGEEEHE